MKDANCEQRFFDPIINLDDAVLGLLALESSAAGELVLEASSSDRTWVDGYLEDLGLPPMLDKSGNVAVPVTLEHSKSRIQARRRRRRKSQGNRI